MLYRDIIELETEKPEDLTKRVNMIIKNSEIKDGLCNIFVQSSAAGFILMDFHPLLIEDFKRLFSEIDENKMYNHPQACAQLRASLLKKELMIPLFDSGMALKERQNIVLWNFVKGKLKIIVTVYGK